MDKEKRWLPEEGETYYFLDTVYGVPYQRVWRNGRMDRLRFRLHNVFESAAEAYHYVERIEEND